MGGFYLTLPSNASADVYPNNKIGDYKVRLADRIRLPREQYEIALMQITYVHSVNTFDSGKKDHILYCFDGNVEHEIPLGHLSFTSPEDLIEHLNFTLRRALLKIYKNVEDGSEVDVHDKNNNIRHEAIYFRQKTSLHKVAFKNAMQEECRISISEKLAAILGFAETVFPSSPRDYLAELIPDICAGGYSLFVYCDLVEPQFVGDKKTPLLRQVPFQTQEGDVADLRFSVPYYIPLHTSDFDTVHIRIANESGEIVPFTQGLVSVTLHIRPL